jgi:hypothetical protein
MELREPPDPRRREIIPVVQYSTARRIAGGNPDYWDHATLLELAVLAGDQQHAIAAMSNALAAIRDIFEPDTTANNLAMIFHAKERRGESEPWMAKIVERLRERANPKAASPEHETEAGPR